MRAMIEEASPEQLARLQALALAEGAVLKHLQTALFTASTDARLLASRELSRQLLSLWTGTDNPQALELLLRAIPPGLVVFLDSKEVPPEDEFVDLDARDKRAGERPKRLTQVEVRS